MTDDMDRLISRIVDQEATDADWRALHAMADSEPTIWRELAKAQRDQAELGAQVEAALACAERVDVPSHEHFSQSMTERLRVVTTWSGWVAAALVMLAWTGAIDIGLFDAPQSDGTQTGTIVRPFAQAEPEEGLDYFISEGRKQGIVVGMMPQRYVLDVVTDEGGGATKTVYYGRLIVQKETVDTLYMHPTDELGRPDPLVRIPMNIQTQPLEPGTPGVPD